MKIGVVLPGGVDRGGEERVIHARLWLLERLARRHEVHVFALGQDEEPGEWELSGTRVHDVGRAPGRLRRLLRRFGDVHRAARFDVVQAWFGPAGAYAAALGWRHRVPVVFSPSGGEFVSMPDVGYGMRTTRAGRTALRVALAGARRVTVASEPMRDLAAMHGVRAECVPLGVALDRWPAAAPRARDTSRPARLLHVADLRPVKDQATLLAAALRMRDAGLDFTLDVVGADTMAGAVQRSDEAQGLGGVVRWHGVLRRDALRPLFDAADALLVTSRHESGPVVALEAAVAGVPVVGTAVGHVAEWAPQAAVAVRVGDDVALARETIALLADDARRVAMACEAQRRAVRVDADHTVRALERIYGEVTARS